jgi:hypothetical protein
VHQALLVEAFKGGTRLDIQYKSMLKERQGMIKFWMEAV